jgi:hypothetical protein
MVKVLQSIPKLDHNYFILLSAYTISGTNFIYLCSNWKFTNVTSFESFYIRAVIVQSLLGD